MRNHSRRPGVVAFWSVVVLTIVCTLSAVLTMQGLAQRRVLEQRQNELQARWLLQSGFELAVQRLLANPTGYEGETVELIPRSQVKITVAPVKDSPGAYRVTSDAHYPTDRTVTVHLTVERTYQRSGDKNQAQITALNKE